MAGELSVVVGLEFSKGVARLVAPGGRGPLTYSYDVAGGGSESGRQVVGTSEAALQSLSTTPGYLLLRNSHASAVVQVRGAVGETPLVALRAAGVALFELDPGAAPTLESDTASTPVDYWLVDL